MEGMMIFTAGKVVGMIVSMERPIEFFNQVGRLGLDVQRVRLAQPVAIGGTYEVQTAGGTVMAHVIDNLAPVDA